MKFANIIAGLLATTVLFCGCIKDNSAAIKVNDRIITKSEFYDDFNKIKETQLKNQPAELKSDDSFLVLSLKSKYVNDVIFRELLAQEFEKRKIEVTQKEIDDKKAEIVSQIGGEDKFKKLLKENGISNQRLQKDLASEVKTIKLLEQLNAPKISEKDAQKYYNDNKAQFNMPERVLVSHILIDTNPDNIKRKIVEADKDVKLSTAQIEEKVNQEVKKQKEVLAKALKQAKANPADFAKVAKEFSQDEGSAQNGGSLGYIVKGQTVPEFEKAAFSQKTGTVSDPVTSQFGEHIIYVQDKAAKGLMPYDKVKNDIIKMLDGQTKAATLQKFATGLKEKSTIEFPDESLNPVNINKKIDEVFQKQIQSFKDKQVSEDNKEAKETKK